MNEQVTVNEQVEAGLTDLITSDACATNTMCNIGKGILVTGIILGSTYATLRLVKFLKKRKVNKQKNDYVEIIEEKADDSPEN